MLENQCPSCGERNFPISKKLRLMHSAFDDCSNCKSHCKVSGVYKLLVYAIAAFSLSTVFVLLFGLVGFAVALVLAILLDVLVYLVAVYWVPLENSRTGI